MKSLIWVEIAKGGPKDRNPSMRDLSRPQAGGDGQRNRLQIKEVPVRPGMPPVVLVLMVPLAIDKVRDIEMVLGVKTQCHDPLDRDKMDQKPHSLVVE